MTDATAQLIVNELRRMNEELRIIRTLMQQPSGTSKRGDSPAPS